MGIRGTRVVVFSLTLLFCGCMLMGCSSLPFTDRTQQETPQHTVGFSSGNLSTDSPEYTNFADALSDLTQIEYTGTGNATPNVTPEKGILYIRGDDVDSTGNARSWMFVVRNQNDTTFVTYTRNGRSIAGWSAGFNGTIIPEDKIFPIRDLFDQNHAAIFEGQVSNTTGSWDIIMENGNYTLTTHGAGVSRPQTFNATSGVLISAYA